MTNSHERLSSEFAEWIRSADARRAYQHMICHAESLAGFRCFPRQQGYIRSFRYMRGSEWPFAFIVNRDSLLFYFRKAGLSNKAANESFLRGHFRAVGLTKNGEIKVRLEGLSDAERLVGIVFPRAAVATAVACQARR